MSEDFQYEQLGETFNGKLSNFSDSDQIILNSHCLTLTVCLTELAHSVCGLIPYRI